MSITENESEDQSENITVASEAGSFKKVLKKSFL